MKFLSALIFLWFFASPVQAAWVQPVDKLVCSDELSPWSKPKSCACPEGTRYNEKIGQCLSGERYPIMVAGYLRSKNALEDGVSLETQFGNFKVIIRTAELQRISKANGLYFEIEGEFILLQKEPTIVADHLRWLE